MPNRKQSQTQIVATIGPASKDKKTIKDMIERQMDAARLNFSWGTYAEHAAYIKNIREISKELGRRIPIIQDLSGPRLQETTGHEFNKEAVDVITPKDLADLQFGLQNGVDYVAMSFVGSALDVLKLREEMKKIGKVVPIIAKIERKVAVQNLDAIIAASDAVMIARGDLGNDVPLEQIPFIEEEIIEKCKRAGKPSITATQMLYSMTKSETPTRAEVTDVAYAVLAGSDAVMLSEETANGKNPVKAVAMMEEIVLEAEKHNRGMFFNHL